ncbi:MAG: hypothetical protein RBU37_01830 [Myxococcota bacterium]|jgi:hypothetical protein|nr:hypothetical protein [Myxococcota bacterium]
MHRATTLLLIFVTGCTGLTLGEQAPDSPKIDVYLESGAIAIDSRTQHVYMLTKSSNAQDELGGKLYRASPDSSTPSLVKDLRGMTDLRMLFPASGILLMAEDGDLNDSLTLLDHRSLMVKKERSFEVKFHGSRLSGSGRYLAVADNTSEASPIMVFDTETLESITIPHDGQQLEAMWSNQGDILLAVVGYNPLSEDASARFLAWDFSKTSPLLQLTDPAGKLWANPLFDLSAEHATMDFFFSFSWVGVSPDDRYAVFPMLLVSNTTPEGPEPTLNYDHLLYVVDLATGNMRTVMNAKGPVGFSADSSAIVSYRENGSNTDILLVDVDDLSENTVELDYSGPQFFITREGNVLVIAPTNDDAQGLVLHDLNSGESRFVEGPSLQLNHFTSRVGANELWIIDEGVHRLDFVANQLETINLDWTPSSVNYLAARDLLVFNDTQSPRFVFWSPTERSITRSVPILD